MNAKKISPEEATPEEPASAAAAEFSAASSSAAVDADASSSATAKAAADAKAEPKAKADAPAAKSGTGSTASGASVVKAEQEVPEPTGHDAPAAHEPTGEVPSAPQVQTVYVTAPTPPRPKGNRGIGILFSVLATLAFALVYLAVAAVLTMIVSPRGVVKVLSEFFSSPLFSVPVLVFLVLMILWALLANRASWWSWVIGSLVVAVGTYFISIGIFLLMQGGFGMTASAASDAFVRFTLNPAMIAAALVARECAIWFGAAIARRGRRVRERNYEAWQAFELDEAQKRAGVGGTTAA